VDEDQRVVAERSLASGTDAPVTNEETPAQEPLVWPKLHLQQAVTIEGFPFVIARMNAGTVVVRPDVSKIRHYSARRAIRRLFRP
jgi:hypothetical protein